MGVRFSKQRGSELDDAYPGTVADINTNILSNQNQMYTLSRQVYTYLPIFLPTYFSIYLTTYLPIYLPTYLFIHLSTHDLIPIYPPTCLSIYLSTYLSPLSGRHITARQEYQDLVDQEECLFTDDDRHRIFSPLLHLQTHHHASSSHARTQQLQVSPINYTYSLSTSLLSHCLSHTFWQYMVSLTSPHYYHNNPLPNNSSQLPLSYSF